MGVNANQGRSSAIQDIVWVLLKVLGLPFVVTLHDTPRGTLAALSGLAVFVGAVIGGTLASIRVGAGVHS